MPSIYELHDRVGVVLLESFGPCRYERRIVLAPHCEGRRAVGAEVFLELRIQRDVCPVIDEVAELNLFISGTSYEVVVEVVCLGRDNGRIRRPVDVL